MTATRSSPIKPSGCFVLLLLLLLDATYGDSTPQFDCGKSSHCVNYCSICDSYFNGPTMDCISLLFRETCFTQFKEAMDTLNSTEWCSWGSVRGPYNNFSLCTEEICDCLIIPWPNPLVEQTFVSIHNMFFQECPTEELSDPPPGIVFALVITPICLIPVMVILVVLKTKNGDGSS
ncbi:receptor activity-modifying protein 2 isoform X2 [Genypterus blacodes]|uniref:receptor activity-modifying protein 2 isoform X2 n=1 Tax=Genypterus blacodes TaxID=154954 RepID=UPI003F7594F0